MTKTTNSRWAEIDAGVRDAGWHRVKRTLAWERRTGDVRVEARLDYDAIGRTHLIATHYRADGRETELPTPLWEGPISEVTPAALVAAFLRIQTSHGGELAAAAAAGTAQAPDARIRTALAAQEPPDGWTRSESPDPRSWTLDTLLHAPQANKTSRIWRLHPGLVLRPVAVTAEITVDDAVISHLGTRIRVRQRVWADSSLHDEQITEVLLRAGAVVFPVGTGDTAVADDDEADDEGALVNARAAGDAGTANDGGDTGSGGHTAVVPIDPEEELAAAMAAVVTTSVPPLVALVEENVGRIAAIRAVVAETHTLLAARGFVWDGTYWGARNQPQQRVRLEVLTPATRGLEMPLLVILTYERPGHPAQETMERFSGTSADWPTERQTWEGLAATLAAGVPTLP